MQRNHRYCTILASHILFTGNYSKSLVTLQRRHRQRQIGWRYLIYLIEREREQWEQRDQRDQRDQREQRERKQQQNWAFVDQCHCQLAVVLNKLCWLFICYSKTDSSDLQFRRCCPVLPTLWQWLEWIGLDWIGIKYVSRQSQYSVSRLWTSNLQKGTFSCGLTRTEQPSCTDRHRF